MANPLLHSKQESKALEQLMRTTRTTLKWLFSVDKVSAEEKLWSIIEHNLNAYSNLVHYVGELPEEQRMVRLSSDFLTGFTHPDLQWFWSQRDVHDHLEKHLSVIGEYARLQGVKLSMHPDQFVVLASENDGIVERSLEEMEYHALIASYMGYAKRFADFKVNIHIGGKKGPEGFRAAYDRLSLEAQRVITLENDEMTWGLDAILTLADLLPLVLDIHHHWVASGEYIQVNDDRVKAVIDSWRGNRPTLHYLVSREDVLVDHPVDALPNRDALFESGYKKSHLRAHSDQMWNQASNEWANSFRESFDIMIEAKHKNLAVESFLKR